MSSQTSTKICFQLEREGQTQRAEEKDGRREKYRNREKERKIIASIAMSLDHHFNC